LLGFLGPQKLKNNPPRIKGAEIIFFGKKGGNYCGGVFFSPFSPPFFAPKKTKKGGKFFSPGGALFIGLRLLGFICRLNPWFKGFPLYFRKKNFS